MLLVIGIAEFGRAWMTKNILTGAAREAVRILAVKPPWPGGLTPLNRAQDILTSAGIIIPGMNNATIPLSSTTTMRREY